MIHGNKLTLPPPDFPTRCFLLLPPAFLIAVKYDIPHVLVITFLLLLIPIFRKKPEDSSKRVLLFGVPAALVLAFVPNYMFEPDPARLSMGDALLKSHLFVPLLVYATAFMCTMKRSRERSSFIAMLSVLTILICGDIMNPKALTNIRFPGTTPLIHRYMFVYTACAILQAFGVIQLLTLDARATIPPGEGRRTANRLRFLILLLVPCLLFAEIRFYAGNERTAKELEHYMLEKMRRRRFRSRKSSLDQELRIQSRFADGMQPSGEILLRVYAARTPGYLRGRAADVYEPGGIWKTSIPPDQKTELQDLTFDRDLAVSYYPVQAQSIVPDKETMEIFFDSRFQADYFPVPGNVTGMEMVSDKTFLSPDGVVTALNPSFKAGYTVHVPAFRQETAMQTPRLETEKDRNRFLVMPAELHTALQVFRTALFSGPVTERQAMEKITQFLRQSYTYSLNPPDGPGLLSARLIKQPPRDPVLRFLTYTGAGHCELFASSAVLLLRACGIPARYITGFVCTERHPAGYYYATDWHAHAWAEAWDSAAGEWVLLDPTPDSWMVPIPGPDYSAFDRETGRIGSWFRHLFSDLFRGYPGKFITTQLRNLGDFLKTPAGITILIFLFAGGTLLFIRIRRRRNPAHAYSPEIRDLRRRMFRLERLLARKTGIRRNPELSWSEWAALFRNEELQKLVRDYENLRYGTKPCPADAADTLKQQIQNFIQKSNTKDFHHDSFTGR